MSTVPQPSNGARCRGRNRAGLPCQRRAVKDGFCTTHHPTEGQDMRELGRRGRNVRPQTRLRKAADDDLREKARQALAEALDGDDEKRRFEAARALFSFRAGSPPEERKDFAGSQVATADGRPVTGLSDVIRFGLEIGALSPAVIEVCREVAAAHEGAPPESFSRNPASSAPATRLE